MTRLWADGASITPHGDAQHHLRAFTWHGRTHTIQRVHQQWQVAGDWWSEAGEVSRDYVAVTTTAGLLCVLYYDHDEQRWYLAKVYD